MALLNRLFPNKKRTRKQGYVPFGRNEFSRWKPFSFTRDQVRLLLFRECDARGRKLLFDSSAVQKTNIDGSQSSRLRLGLKSKCDNTKKTETYVEVTNGYGYQYTRPNSDVTLMGEMIFGSVAMTYKGMSSKIHSMKSPDRFMCSRVFHAPAIHLNCKRKSDQSIDSSGSSVSSINDSLFSQSGNYESKLGSSGGSGPLDVPISDSSVKVPKNSLEGDSGFCGDASLRSISSVGSGFWNSFPYLNEMQNGSLVMSPGNVNNSGGSLASLQRRWMRNLSTSLEFGLTSSHWYLKGKVLSGLSDEGFCRPHRKTQLGLTVVITLTPEEEKEMEFFVFDHVAIIDNMLERLQNNIEKAYMKKEIFVHSMMDAFLELQQWFCDLFTAPRLPTPVWIGLVSTSDFYRESSRLRFDVASAFLKDLCQLIASIDTKATNFFISTLVTAVLTHHLGWVATILPAKAPPSSVTKSPCTVQILHALAKSHPYNALWAQLGDLHGAVGNPVKIARTIVTANVKKNELLNKLLCCLSYFIRCGNIEKRTDNQIAIESEMNIVDSTMESLSLASLNSSTASSSTIVPDDSPCFEKQDKNLLTDGSKTFNLSQRTFSTTSKDQHSVDGDLLIKDNTFPHSLNIDQGGSGFHKSRTLAANLNISSEENEEVVKQTDARSSATDSYLHPDVISEKVSRLCRVPTNALLYHMKTAPSILSAETFVPQKIDCEKQLSSVEVSDRSSSVVIANPRRENENICNKASADKKSNEGVIFVLGDNDELVDLKCQSGFSIMKSKSDNILSGENVCFKTGESKCCPSLGGWKHVSKSSSNFPCLAGIPANEGTFCEVEGQVCADVNCSSTGENYFLNEEETGLDSGIVLEEDTSTKCDNPISVCVSDEDALWKNERTNQSISENCCVVVGSSSLLKDVNGNPRLDVKHDDHESKVVTSHSFVIDLEDVHGYKDVKIPHPHKKYSKQVSRSQSLSFPESKYSSKGRTASICRRHSENIHLNERYLRNYHSVRFNFERCDGVLSDYVDGIGVEKSPESENSKKLFDARENFELQEKCESCKCAEQGIVFNSVLCSSNTCNCVNIANECVDHVSSKLKADCDEREGNALFDDYGLLSDEELQSSIEVNPESVPSVTERENTAFPLLLELPLPQYNYSQREQTSGFAASLLGGVSDHYMPDMVLHGCTQGVSQWEATLKRDLSVSAHRSMLDQDVSEAVCIVGNADLWEVQVVSSQITLADKPGGFGIRIGMSQLVANMLESLLHLWKLRIPPEQCLQHLESKLRELCLRSQALAELLMTTEFCDLATVTSSLGLEANDVPLLLAIASTHTPQVTSQYGLSFH